MDGSLIAQLWRYFVTPDDGGVYSSFVELPSLPYFDSDVAIIIIIFISLPSSAHTSHPLCSTSPRIIEDMSHARGLRSVPGDAWLWSAQRI